MDPESTGTSHLTITIARNVLIGSLLGGIGGFFSATIMGRRRLMSGASYGLFGGIVLGSYSMSVSQLRRYTDLPISTTSGLSGSIIGGSLVSLLTNSALRGLQGAIGFGLLSTVCSEARSRLIRNYTQLPEEHIVTVADTQVSGEVISETHPIGLISNDHAYFTSAEAYDEVNKHWPIVRSILRFVVHTTNSNFESAIEERKNKHQLLLDDYLATHGSKRPNDEIVDK